MRSLAPLLFFALAAPVSAELVFYWDESKIPESQRPAAEERVRAAALKYEKKQYADMGVYDFLQTSEEYIIAFGREEGIASYQPRLQVLFIDDSLTNKKHLLEYIAFHEFSHAYDYVKRDELSKVYLTTKEKEKRKMLVTKIGNLGNYALQHERAFARENIYVQDMKKTVPEKEYQRLQKVRAVLDDLRNNVDKQHEWRSRFAEIYQD